MSEDTRCPSCGLSPFERGIGDSQISRIVADHNVLKRKLAQEQARKHHWKNLAIDLADAVKANDPELIGNDLGNALDAIDEALKL